MAGTEKGTHSFTAPQELLDWMKEHDEFKEMGKEDAGILLGYLEGHGYRLGADKDGGLVRIDMGGTDGNGEPYTLDDAIDTAQEWNYELIKDTEQAVENAQDASEKEEKRKYLDSLRKDEEVLDRLFEQTKYGEMLDRMATEIAAAIVQGMQEKNADQVIRLAADSIRNSSTKEAR